MVRLISFYYFLIVFFFNPFIFSIIIDGKLSEQEWQDAETLNNFLTVFPNDKSDPIYKTKIQYFSNSTLEKKLIKLSLNSSSNSVLR